MIELPDWWAETWNPGHLAAWEGQGKSAPPGTILPSTSIATSAGPTPGSYPGYRPDRHTRLVIVGILAPSSSVGRSGVVVQRHGLELLTRVRVVQHRYLRFACLAVGAAGFGPANLHPVERLAEIEVHGVDGSWEPGRAGLPAV